MSKLTAMQELIKKLKMFSDNAQQQSADFERENMVMSSFNSGAMASAYKVAILAAEQLLEPERQQHYDTFCAGSERGTGEIPFNCEQYFTQTFTQNQQP